MHSKLLQSKAEYYIKSYLVDILIHIQVVLELEKVMTTTSTANYEMFFTVLHALQQ